MTNKKISYLENLAKTNELILLDANIFNPNVGENTILNQIYESKDSLCFDISKAEEIMDYHNQLLGIIINNNNFCITKSIFEENSRILEITNQSISYNNRRINALTNKNVRRKILHRKMSLGRRFRNKKRPSVENEDLEYEKQMLETLKKYEKNIFSVSKILEKKIIKPDSEKFDKIFLWAKSIGNIPGKKQIKNDPFRKAEDIKGDEDLVANSFCRSYDQPVNILSLDGDIRRLCNFLYKSRELKSIVNKNSWNFPKNPVHLHTFEPNGNMNLMHRVSYLLYV